MNLNEKHVVITGAAGGIGSAMARLFSERGAKVTVSDLDVEAVEAVANDINGFAVECNVADEASINALISKSVKHFGQIDLFCSNAGFASGEGLHAASASDEVWQRNWDVHVMSHVYASRALLPNMIERGDGYLLNVASAAGLLNQISDAAYSATKHAAVSFAESLAISHGDDGIKVSVVCPQYVNTNILGLSEEDAQKQMKGVLSPEQCAQSILEGIENEQFLITPHAEIRTFMQQRGENIERWLSGMIRYRKSLLDAEGKVDFNKIFST